MSRPIHETISLTRRLSESRESVWGAYADSNKRAVWSVPAGEEMVYSNSDFRVDGGDSYRCGTPDTLEFQAKVDYVRIVPEELIVYTESVFRDSELLSTALVTWEFEANNDGTLVTLTSQVISFVGAGMIEGTDNGHSKALDQLLHYLAVA